MTRTTDDLNPNRPWKPFGEKVTKPAPAAPEQKPRGEYGIVPDKDGRMRTTKGPKP